MTRFLDTEDWQPDSEENWRRASAAPLPSFLREEPLDRAEVADLTLHFHDVGPSFRAAVGPAQSMPESTPDSTQEMALEPATPAQGRQWTPALAYSSFFAAQPHSYEIAPGSYLAEAEPLPASESLSPADVAAAEAAGRAWDPLVDPWPADDAADGIEAALVEHAVRERELSIVPDLVESEYDDLSDSFRSESVARPSAEPDDERSPFESVAYQPVVFSPAPFVPETPQGVQPALEDTAMMTQPFDLSLQHPSGPLPRAGVWPPPPVVPASPAELMVPQPPADEVPASIYDVSLTGPLGTIDLGFTGGHWYSLAGDEARPVTTGEAVRSHPELAGQIVQVVSWWMREHPKTDRALDLATELAMAVSEVVRSDRSHALR